MGTGVGVVAIGCDDPAAVWNRAVAAGATAPPATAGGAAAAGIAVRVPGMEPVTHLLVPRARDAAGRGPGEPGSGDGTAPQCVDHLALSVRTGELAGVTGFYRDGLGLTRIHTEYVEVGDQAMDSTVVRSGSGGLTLTLVEPVAEREAGQLTDFLAANDGPGVQHVALLVGDLVTAKARVAAGGAGVRFLDTPDSYYDVLAERVALPGGEIDALRGTGILLDTDGFGSLLQIFTRSPFPRGTLFYELVERRAARSFGSANIRALFEAVARDRLKLP
ncbi:VOC family protein [Dactylosporangium sp. NPDC050588]|uniref:VOC family protein n=1 Tax=Dactylosporangium sp. NPDC050588 TaxID=3157211 RepID=UPI00340FDFCF